MSNEQFKFCRWDTLDWNNPEDQTETSTHHCAPTRRQILDSHRCLMLDEYLTNIGVREVTEWEEERGILGSGFGNGYDVTRIGIETDDVPANYRSSLSRLFNKLDKMGIACTLPSSEQLHYGNGNTIDLANERWLKDHSDLEYSTYGNDHYIFYPQRTQELTDLAMGIDEALEDSSLINEDLLSEVEDEACEEYWQTEGDMELLKYLIEQHSHFLEFGRPLSEPNEWGDMEEDAEWDDDEYDSFAQAMLKDGDGVRGIDEARHIIDDCSGYRMIYIEQGCNDYHAADNSESVVKDVIERRLLKDESFQKLWDLCIDTADAETFTWLCTTLCGISWSYGNQDFDLGHIADAACLVTERIEVLAIASDKQAAKERGQLPLIKVGVTSK